MENAAVALKALDKNGDGKLTADEIDDAVTALPRTAENAGRAGR